MPTGINQDLQPSTKLPAPKIKMIDRQSFLLFCRNQMSTLESSVSCSWENHYRLAGCFVRVFR